MANRNKYSRTKEGRASIAGLREKYPWLKGDSPIMQLMQRRYAHPDEVVLAINSSYDGDIPDSIDGFSDFMSNAASPYNVFANDAWDMLTQHGPSTLETIESYIPAEKLNSPGLVDEITDYVRYLMGIDNDWANEDLEDGDVIYNNYAGDFDSDDFRDFEDNLMDLFDDARAYNRSKKTIKEAEDSKDTWLDKLYNKRKGESGAVDSNGDPKGKDGLAGTKDDRGTGSADDEYDDGYDDAADSDDDETDNVLSDATQKNILSALLGHSL